MAAAFPFHEIAGSADGCARAEEAQRLNPLPPASSGRVMPGVVASETVIDAWMESAKKGDRFVYAVRSALPRRRSGASRMYELAQRGLVSLYQNRCDDLPDLFAYGAERTAAPTALAKPERPQLSALVIDAEAALVDALLPVLERAARFGRPCPTDKQLAAKSGLAPAEIEAAMQALVLANLIRVHQAPRPTLRRITIVATGAQTGLAA